MNPTRSPRAPRPLPTSRWALLWEEHRGGFVLLGIFIALVALYVITRVDAARIWEARLLALAFPVTAAVVLVRCRPASRRWLATALACTVLILVGSEIEVWRALFPPDPLAKAFLTPDHPDATLELPSTVHEFRAQVRGHLQPGEESVHGAYGITLRRQEPLAMEGTFHRRVRWSRSGRRGAPAKSVEIHEHEAKDIVLEGDGAATVHLDVYEGDLVGPVEVALLPPAGSDGALLYLFGAVLATAVLAEAVASRKAVELRLAPPVAMCVVFAVTAANHLNPDDPFTSVLGATLLGAIGGGALGWVVAAIARRLAAPPVKTS